MDSEIHGEKGRYSDGHLIIKRKINICQKNILNARYIIL